MRQDDHQVLLYKLHQEFSVTYRPNVCFSLRIFHDLSVSIWINDIKLHHSELSWLLGHTKGKLTLWSQLSNLLTRYASNIVEQDSVSTCHTIATVVEELGVTISKQPTCSFLAEQIRLLCTSPKARRYSVDMIISGFSFYHRSRACYLELQKVLVLPSIRVLRDISSNLSVGGNLSHAYLHNKAKCLEPRELIVNLQIDEVHIKSKLVYESGKLIGNADNSEENKPANRLQCFLISSIMSPNRDVVPLIPVQKMDAEYLTSLLKDVITTVTRAGYTIISIISENNVINRKSFISLGGCDQLVPSMKNPVNDKTIVFLFDSVHLLKSVRNNWINLKNYLKTFTFPDIDDNSVILHASFIHLETMYNLEADSTLKQAYRLTIKALHPHSIERQNVRLALKIFDDTTAKALLNLGPKHTNLLNWLGTSKFISTIIKLWDMLNVKSYNKGLRLRKEDANVFDNVSDDRLEWMERFVVWLNVWKSYNTQHDSGFLYKETFLALSHTVSTFVIMIRDLLSNGVLDYVLTGKFQTDQLESRFGHYRQLSGSNYLVSVADVLQSEKKLKVKRLLRLYTASKGTVSIKNYLSTFGECTGDKVDTNFVDQFPYSNLDTLAIKDDDLPALLLVAGYVARKGMEKSTCISCKEIFGSTQKPLNLDINMEHFAYFDSINRGGLIYPTNFLFNILLCSYCIFNSCISQLLEGKFLSVCNQKHTLVATIEKYLTNNDKYAGMFLSCDDCDKE